MGSFARRRRPKDYGMPKKFLKKGALKQQQPRSYMFEVLGFSKWKILNKMIAHSEELAIEIAKKQISDVSSIKTHSSDQLEPSERSMKVVPVVIEKKKPMFRIKSKEGFEKALERSNAKVEARLKAS